MHTLHDRHSLPSRGQTPGGLRICPPPPQLTALASPFSADLPRFSALLRPRNPGNTAIFRFFPPAGTERQPHPTTCRYPAGPGPYAAGTRVYAVRYAGQIPRSPALNRLNPRNPLISRILAPSHFSAPSKSQSSKLKFHLGLPIPRLHPTPSHSSRASIVNRKSEIRCSPLISCVSNHPNFSSRVNICSSATSLTKAHRARAPAAPTARRLTPRALGSTVS